MRITGGNVFRDGRFFEEDLYIDGDKIADKSATSSRNETRQQSFDASGCYVVPGLIDIHTHGACGADASDASVEGLQTMSHFLATQGVTSFCPTTMTLAEEQLLRVIDCIAQTPISYAKIAGIHLEGPFISVQKKGAQNEHFICEPDTQMMDRLFKRADRKIKLITVAPEAKGAIPFIEQNAKKCTVSLGHSASDYACASAAYKAGATHTTHLFNGMNTFQSREPGIIGAAYDHDATVELICDGIHLHPATIRMTFAMFEKRCVLISDSLRCAGMPDGIYELGGQRILLQAGRAMLNDNTLAGSAISLLQAVQNAVRFGIPLENAIYASTIAPAKVIGLDAQIGNLKAGMKADVVILDKKLNVKAVFIDGNRVV